MAALLHHPVELQAVVYEEPRLAGSRYDDVEDALPFVGKGSRGIAPQEVHHDVCVLPHRVGEEENLPSTTLEMAKALKQVRISDNVLCGVLCNLSFQVLMAPMARVHRLPHVLPDLEVALVLEKPPLILDRDHLRVEIGLGQGEQRVEALEFRLGEFVDVRRVEVQVCSLLLRQFGESVIGNLNVFVPVKFENVSPVFVHVQPPNVVRWVVFVFSNVLGITFLIDEPLESFFED
mmetsp:Transcript_2001/g.2487  ORF Transcript_2001/g.2487 Transcript_2001/m.2487 type:complete len:234 (+) Transcript_2001:850-1551(+)